MRWCCFALLAACHSSSSTEDSDIPSGSTDTSVADTGVSAETGDPADTGSNPDDSDGTPADSDAADTDLLGDSDIADTGISDPEPWPDTGTEGCDWIDLGAFVANCGGRWTTVYEMVEYPGDAACEAWYRRDGIGYATMEAALASCDSSCVYRPSIAAMVLYCGYRGEYTVFADGGPGQTAPVGSCPSLVYGNTFAGSGWASSWEEYTSAHPCPTPTE